MHTALGWVIAIIFFFLFFFFLLFCYLGLLDQKYPNVVLLQLNRAYPENANFKTCAPSTLIFTHFVAFTKLRTAENLNLIS